MHPYPTPTHHPPPTTQEVLSLPDPAEVLSEVLPQQWADFARQAPLDDVKPFAFR